MMWYLELYLFLMLVDLIQAKLFDHNNHISLAHNPIFYKVIQDYPLSPKAFKIIIYFFFKYITFESTFLSSQINKNAKYFPFWKYIMI